MCGIAGIFSYREEQPSTEILKNMLGQIRYRGPDESGVYIDRNIGIGNVRLSIIDLSTGQQPMCNDDGTLWIVYNGEVFNYIELRQELKKKGVIFRTDSDTEVILRYYEHYREKCVNYFNGQFAFAIWDTKKQSLFLARDRVGIRPLFYTDTTDGFVFGSEIKAILQSHLITPELNPEGLQQVFTFWTTINSATCFKGIYELPPGHYAVVSKNRLDIDKFWQLEFPDSEFNYINHTHNATEELNALFEDAVMLRLRADVPVAAYLSGGIDSSATTWFIKKVAKDQLNTFSIGFADSEFDETTYQNEVAASLNTRHIGFKCENRQIAENFPEVA